MSPTLGAFLRSWPCDPWLTLSLSALALCYARGLLRLRRRHPRRWRWRNLLAFLGGLGAIFLALASPIEPFTSLLLEVHMAQHLLLMMVAPPLVWLGAPLVPLLIGMPRPIRVHWIAPLLRAQMVRHAGERLTHPLVALPVYVGVTWFWHVPAVYEQALRSVGWHYVEHVCFLSAALLFWYPVVRPFPSRARWSLWLLLPYLLLADLQNTVLAALLTFTQRVIYPYYAEVPRLGGLSALEDQAIAGVIMWVPGSVAFLLPLFWIALGLLYGRPRALPVRQATKVHMPIVERRAPRPPAALDLLRLPVLGRFLGWRHARPLVQLALGAFAGAIVWDGLRGPPMAGMNLAGVVPWIHWRALVVVSLLAAGNFFCFACPFTLPRRWVARWLPTGREWPKALRNKWLAVGLLLVFLWSYEALSLWDRPRWTAWLVLGYFGAALVVDTVFRGGTFCKYVCPIGQFNFVQSFISPFQVGVREPAACATCHGHECIRGHAGARGSSKKGTGIWRQRKFAQNTHGSLGASPLFQLSARGCELQLFQPHKSGNMDCTFCLDCVAACPYDNIGILAAWPGQELWQDAHGSGVGRLARRPDIAALVVVLMFGALANAAAMVRPVVAWQDSLGQLLGQASPWLVTSGLAFLALVVAPVAVMGSAAGWSRRWGRLDGSLVEVATRFAYALVPLGFSMWLAHYSFHFITSWGALIPTTQRFVHDLAGPLLGAPQWGASCCVAVGQWIPRTEILLLDCGFLFSLYAAWRIARSQSTRSAAGVKAFLPWGLVVTLLFSAGVWIVLQPMEMRGTLSTVGEQVAARDR